MEKPSGIPTTAPPTAGVRSLVDEVRAIVTDAEFVHPLSRLDVEVTGCVLFALDARALASAQTARDRGEYQRRYLALLAGVPEPVAGAWTVAIGTDPREPRKRVAGRGRDIEQARSEYEVFERRGDFTRVHVDLRTGRTHQVRVHAAHAGCPVVGDRTYGGPRMITGADGATTTARRVMLHALRVEVPGRRAVVESAPPEDLERVWAALATP